jgi:hypothetical protein
MIAAKEEAISAGADCAVLSYEGFSSSNGNQYNSCGRPWASRTFSSLSADRTHTPTPGTTN